MGLQWMRSVHTYEVDTMRRVLEEAFTSPFNGLKVIIAEGECQPERQRRIKPWIAGLLQRGERPSASSTASTKMSAAATTPASACPAARR